MIILDTNVISELMREKPHENVKAWVAAHKPTDLSLTTITVAEIQRGLARLPKGKRRSALERSFSAFINEAFRGRIYSFDEEAAFIYGSIAAKREKEGFNTDAVDLMIAAIVKAQNASIATRNTKDFDGCGIKVINPWKPE
ncbi:MAG: type II toxin-antitoxin system VapC family toxin [Candidatus Hinthialibacter antarcticus]|nr:type II toxin-antitoxin system VapC family toxin [Candidatus Hinthialibacter antarcticus]